MSTILLGKRGRFRHRVPPEAHSLSEALHRAEDRVGIAQRGPPKGGGAGVPLVARAAGAARSLSEGIDPSAGSATARQGAGRASRWREARTCPQFPDRL